MGCFLACFGASKDRKRRRPVNKTLPTDGVYESSKPLEPSVSTKELTDKLAAGLLPEFRDRENQEQPSPSSIKKKVTFDLNVKTYAEVIIHEDPKYSSEDDEEKGATKEVEEHKGSGNSTPPNLGAYPLNHRYQNCASSDEDDNDNGEEEDEEIYENSDIDEEDSGRDIGGNEEEDSFESYFSLPMEKERDFCKEVNSPKPISGSSPDRQPPLLANRNARVRSHYVHSVLNPVENLLQWKEVKVKTTESKHPKKENINLEQEREIPFGPEPTFKIRNLQKSFDLNPSSNLSAKKEILVDASLSSWLVSSEREGPHGSNSYCSNSSLSHEDRPILGALTVEDLKQSVTSSPRRSPSRSPDEIPILGTVGSYWSCRKQGEDSGSSLSSGSNAKGIPNTTSKYREDKRVNWHSTPFEVRLERALNNGAAEAYSS